MVTFPRSSFSFILLLIFLQAHARTATADQSICTESTSCESDGLSIQFPFWLRRSNQSHRHICGYPGFGLSCHNIRNHSQPLLALPKSGDFVVRFVSPEDQSVWINDPDECLPRRFLHSHGLNLEGSPFRFGDDYIPVNYSFLNCPSNVTSSHLVPPISCLGLDSTFDDLNYSVRAVLSDPPVPIPWKSSCRLISWALIPVAETRPWLFWTQYNANVPLQWNDPDCGNCEARGGRCGFVEDTPFRVACYNLPSQSQSLSTKAQYGITIGLGMPGLLCIIGLAYFLCGKIKTRNRRPQTSTELSTFSILHPPRVLMGLNSATIEKYPKTQLGDSGRLPKPDDNICSICLCEYQPKETLRTMPECNHYFHSNCIDGWLKMNASCPLCRNLPDRSSSISFSVSLPSSSTS